VYFSLKNSSKVNNPGVVQQFSSTTGNLGFGFLFYHLNMLVLVVMLVTSQFPGAATWSGIISVLQAGGK
jgi:hypothetical protein